MYKTGTELLLKTDVELWPFKHNAADETKGIGTLF